MPLRAGQAAILSSMKLARLAWLLTTLCCLGAAAVVFLRGDTGYAAVALAVAISAAINLLP